jgi:tRNA-(ms[2]io[6]A)-hydroxylase
MLALASSTDPTWVARALEDLDAVLLDHAHCEKKAAGTAVTLIFQYPDRPALLAPLSRLAREELAHFEEVLRWLGRRGLGFRRQKPSAYGGRLHRLVRGAEPGRLLDRLLCCAVIEARSCERLGLLADALPVPELAAFYRSLHAAEARHHGVYVDLACEVASRDEVRERLHHIAAREAEILALGPEAARLHG